MIKFLPLVAALVLAGCTMGPDYVRPEMDVPKDFATRQSTVPVADRWWALFNDPVLEKLVDEALIANRDLKVAAERIEQARAQFVITRAEGLPRVGIEGSRSRDRSSERIGFAPPADAVETDTNRLVLRAAWDIDFWGKYRRGNEAARAELAATEAGRDAIRLSLIGEVVRGYFALKALDDARVVSLRTLETRRQGLSMQQLRYDSGIVSELELSQVQSDVAGAEALVPAIEQRRTRQEGALALLLGRSPRAVFQAVIDRGPNQPPMAVEVPAGLPSELLQRRPDLRIAEQRLVAANARIGIARANYFPAISLTGFFGGESQQLSDLFSGPARTWSIAAGLLQPVFGAGQLISAEEIADSRTREAALLYEQAVANAFRETRDAISAQSTAREIATAQQVRERALSRAFDLARIRYDNGTVSLFDVLEVERQLLLVRLESIDAERDRRAAIVDLYLALGG
ncbi:efflux transporter outer membrane subunit [Usitatibacter palustris]|uniref:Outer membrane protein OprM n=1 Tax=Usitatibacter palustris TaxID=2732487 RepID=A0A6M4H8B0_9PROT|nr:efflux transporter outer membrane subunit [Usitatibacter palustris]QJR15846.1 Outer membrane protein OprM [Usitatibacter palustris]